MVSLTRIGRQLLLVGILWASVRPANAIPSFARKYGLPCSACHVAWPMLNNFGQTFKDNGYQLGNGKDSPIYQDPSYWPIMFRLTPLWHRENTSRKAVDVIPGDPSGGLVERAVTTSGFDLSGIDIIAAGTLSNNISFFVQPFINASGSTALAQSWVRFDNLAGSPWLNVKAGKFELDELISQKRILQLSANGGTYFNYFFTPLGDNNIFTGIGGAQLGVELLGHSPNDYTRYSVSVVSSNNGTTGLTSNNTYDVYANFSQAFDVPKMGMQRIGAYGYFGQSPTYFQTSLGRPILGSGSGNRSFYRVGAYGQWYLGKFDLQTFYMHGLDNVFLGNSVPSNQPGSLPVGAAGPTWNGGFGELNYNYNPRFIVSGRYEVIRMSRQANPATRSDAGNLDSWVVGYRWYPIMNPRAGLAWVQEYGRVLNAGAAPISKKDESTNSLLMGFDFDF